MKWIYSLLRCYVIFVVCGIFCISAYHAINCWCNNLDAWHELFYTERGFGIGVSVLFICFIMGPINVVFITFLHSIKINRFILNNNWNILIESLLYFFIYWLLFLRLYNPKEIGGWYLRWEFLTLYHYMLLFLLLSLHGWCMRKGISSRESSEHFRNRKP